MAEDSGGAPGRRGRGALRFATEVHAKVEVLVAGGMSQDDIAEAIGVSAPTLRKHFRSELSKGAGKQAARQRAMVLDALATKAKEGNVAAAKAYLAELNKAAPPPDAPKPKDTTKGKKAVAQAEADAVVAAGGKFAPRSPPRLAAVNGKSLRRPE